MLTDGLDFERIPGIVRAHRTLGVPYSDQEIEGAAAAARAQAETIAAEISDQGGPAGLGDKQIVALIAYLQRLGTDISKPEPVADEVEAVPESGHTSADEVEVAEAQ